jgi:hypothetical protein
MTLGSVSQTGPPPEIAVQRETNVRGDNNKKNIKQTDFPPEAPESRSNKCETGNAEHSLHDLSSGLPKECPLTGISESYNPAKNDGGANQEEKHSEVFKKNLSFSRGF